MPLIMMAYILTVYIFFNFDKKVKSSKIFFIPAIIFSVISAFLLLMPGSDLPSSDLFELIYFDKWVHIGMFGLLTLLWGFPFIWIASNPRKYFVRVAGLIIIYGILIEFLQKYCTRDRNFDVFDIMADTVGAILAYYALSKRFKIREGGKKNEPL